MWTTHSNARGIRNANTDTEQVYSTISYPQTLGSIRYPYYMVFYVNASSKSTLGKGDDVIDIPTDTNSPNQKLNVGATNKVVRAAGKAVGNTIQYAIDSATNLATNNGANALGSVLPKLSAGQIGEYINNIISFTTPSKRLSQTIALPIPQNLMFASQAAYETASSGFLGSLLNDVAGGNYSQAGKDAAKKFTQNMITAGADWIGEKLGSGATGPNFEMIANRMRGTVQNQRKEQIFQSMSNRTFSFDWLFIPKTEEESKAISDIIKWLKYNHYPEIEGTSKNGSPSNLSGFNLIMPNEFDIQFEMMDNGNSKQMTSLPKIATCVLTDIGVSYTPLGKFIAFNDVNGTPIGNPVAIHLSTTFAEIEPLTRSQIGLGY
jgi:hypothetical protein